MLEDTNTRSFARREASQGSWFLSTPVGDRRNGMYVWRLASVYSFEQMQLKPISMSQTVDYNFQRAHWTRWWMTSVTLCWESHLSSYTLSHLFLDPILTFSVCASVKIN